MQESLVSVIVPVYNGASFVIETLESVAKQTHNRLECIIIDDGSTDNTAALVNDWIAADHRFTYYYQTNKGLSAARNAGLDWAKGDFIQFLDADDVLLPSKLEEQLANWPAEGPAVSYTDYGTGRSADIYSPSDYHKSARLHSGDKLTELITRWESSLTIPPHSFLFNASFFTDKKIRFDTSLPNHEDFDCWVTIFRLLPPITYVDKKLCIYRVTEGSMSKNMRLMGEGFLQVLDKHLGSGSQTVGLRRTLRKKRRETLKRYNRFDKMSFGEKILLIGYLYNYYTKRICQRLLGKTA
ncbi:MAG TPA: glycosyltransferase family 2 protein [Puia sp.]|nr:glycosyltransferase family 2 protein [Puia sp.]